MESEEVSSSSSRNSINNDIWSLAVIPLGHFLNSCLEGINTTPFVLLKRLNPKKSKANVEWFERGVW